MNRAILSLVSLAILFVPVQTFAGFIKDNKGFVRDISGGATAGSEIAFLFPGFGTLIGIGLGAGQAGGLVIAERADRVTSSPTTAEVNQGVIVQRPFTGLIQIDHINPIGPDPDNPSASVHFNQAIVPFNHSLDSLSLMIMDTRLIDMAAERYYGALKVGNIDAANFQRNNVFDFVHQFNSDRDAFHDELKLASSLLNQGGFLDRISPTVNDVISLRDQILASGKFPAAEERVFSEIGLTDIERQGIFHEVSLIDGSTITNSDIQGPVILDRMADRFGQFDIMPLLPPNLVAGPVPEPFSIVMFATGAFTLLCYMWHRRRRSAAERTIPEPSNPAPAPAPG